MYTGEPVRIWRGDEIPHPIPVELPERVEEWEQEQIPDGEPIPIQLPAPQGN